MLVRLSPGRSDLGVLHSYDSLVRSFKLVVDLELGLLQATASVLCSSAC